jgi:hypothetical protein
MTATAKNQARVAERPSEDGEGNFPTLDPHEWQQLCRTRIGSSEEIEASPAEL